VSVTDRIPPWTLAVIAMVSIQSGAALSISLFDDIGPAGTAWLRMALGAIILLAIARPSVRGLNRSQWLSLLGLGAAAGGMTTAFLSALDRLPLGTTVSIEFLGPLTVAAIAGRTLRAALWPLLALVGVVLLTEPWQGDFEWAGVGFALIAAFGWGCYIVMTQHVGDRFSGIEGLALSMPIAALTATSIGLPQAWGNLSWSVVGVGVILALLTPVFPFTLEMIALRKMTKRAFGTLMAVEPAIAAAIGMLILIQIPDPLHLIGMVCVIIAGVVTQRDSTRPVAVVDIPAPVPSGKTV
jgi:inner membrane transporter RhtA